MPGDEIKEDHPTTSTSERDWSWYDLLTEERLKRQFHFIAVPALLLLSLIGGAVILPLFGSRAFFLAYLAALCPVIALGMELAPVARPVGSMRRRILRRTGYTLVVAILYWLVLATLGLLPDP